MTIYTKPYPGFREKTREEMLAEAESTRHLPGKHDQKSHGKGGGSGSEPVTVDAIDDRKAEIRREAAAFLDRVWNGGGSMDEAFSIGTKDPYMFAMSRHGLDLGAAAALDLLGYSEPPTVLSAEEFDAFEGAKVTLPHAYDFHLVADPTGEPLVVEEFGRATGSRKSAENMVYGDTHYVGTGVAGPGTYIGQPTVAAQFAGGLYSSNPSQTKANFANLGRPPNRSIAAEGESYTRVKLKPGTKIVTESEVRKALDQQFDAEQAEWERTGDPDSGRYTALDDAEGRGVSRMVFAAERMGAQAILAQDASDPLRGLVVLDRQALVFDGDFVDPDEAWRAAIRAAAATAVDDLVRQSRGLALLMRVDRGVERRIFDGGQWGDLSGAERVRAVELYDLRYGPSPEEFYTLLVDESKRHLPGKHDQKSHGKKGGSGDVSVGLAPPGAALPPEFSAAWGAELAAHRGSTDASYLNNAGELVNLWGAAGDAKAMVAERIAERMADVPLRDLKHERIAAARHSLDSYAEDRARQEELRINQMLVPNTPADASGPDGEWGYRMVRRLRNGELQVTNLYEAVKLGDLNTSMDDRMKALDTSIPFSDRLKILTGMGYYPAGSPEAIKMFREETTSRLVNQWAMSSNDASPRSLAIQMAVADEFGSARGTTEWKLSEAQLGVASRRDALYRESGSVYRAFVRAQYEETQDKLAEWGVEEVTVARGVKGTRESSTLTRLGVSPSVEREGVDGGGVPGGAIVYRDVPLKTRPASSWTVDADEAANFSGSIGVRATIPADQILATPMTGVGCLHESEVVVLGGFGATGTVIAYERFLDDSDKGTLIRHMRSSVAASGSMRAEVTDEALVLDTDDEEADWLTVLASQKPGVLTDAELYETLGRGEEPAGVVLRSSARHLPGKHDQKSHGKKGAGSGKGGAVGTVDEGLPDGWTARPMTGGTYGSTTRVTKEGTKTSIQIDSMAWARSTEDYSQFRPEEERLAIAERAAVAIARSIDPLYAAHPELADVDLRFTVDAYGGILKPTSAAHMDTMRVVGKDGMMERGVGIVVNPSLFAPRVGYDGFEPADTSVMGDHKIGKTGMAMTANINGLHGEATEAAPVRATIVHEMGHVVDWTTARNPESSTWHEGESQASLLQTDPRSPFASPEGLALYDSASTYATTSHTEFYAEAFSEWHLRDVATPSEAAVAAARYLGWEGADGYEL